MRRIALAAGLCLFVPACFWEPEFGVRAFIAQAPLELEDQQEAPSVYYIEALGNGFSGYEMLTRFFTERARKLCGGEPAYLNPVHGAAYPNARLPKARQWVAGCYERGGYCNADYTRFPLVYGQVRCLDTPAPAERS